MVPILPAVIKGGDMSKITLKFEGDHGNDAYLEVEGDYETWYLLNQLLWKLVEKK